MADRDLHGPFVNLATLCSRAEPTTDGTSILIEVLQGVTVGQTRGPVGARFPSVPLECFAVVALQSGFAQGTFPLIIEMVRPNRDSEPVFLGEVTFRGEEHGETFVQRLSLLIAEPGLYWFDVLLGGRLLTRFPLRVVYEPREAK